MTDYIGPGINFPTGIAAGPDGALWFTNEGNNSIGRITTAGAVTNYTSSRIDDPRQITAGPDGALWFTNYHNNSIGRITTGGLVTNYTGAGIFWPGPIAVGSDGAVWFSNAQGAINSMTTAGVVSTYTGTGKPTGITAGPDGALWFTNSGSIGRITTDVTPGIAKLKPASGEPGTTVEIHGTNLAGATRVAFNGTVAAITSDTATTLVTHVPAGATSGLVTVTTAVGTATSSSSFTVLAP